MGAGCRVTFMGNTGLIGRRGLLVGGAALATRHSAQASLPSPRSGELAFRLLRRGTPIGMHTLEFHPKRDELAVDITVSVLVTFGPFVLARYHHHNRETWQDDRLVGLRSHTDRNGKKLQMSASWTDAGLLVEGSGTTPYIAPDNAFATTYWRKATLLGPLIGTQDGMLMHPTIAQPKPEPIRLASGEQTLAQRYVMRGDLDVELWYDFDDAWLGMRFTVDDGSVVSYERL